MRGIGSLLGLLGRAGALVGPLLGGWTQPADESLAGVAAAVVRVPGAVIGQVAAPGAEGAQVRVLGAIAGQVSVASAAAAQVAISGAAAGQIFAV